MANPVRKSRARNYRNLSPAVVAKLAGYATRIKATLRRSLDEVGRELTEAKDLLNHGQFVDWVEHDVGMTARTAQHIMSAYRLCLKKRNFALLARSSLYLLGAADMPANTLAGCVRSPRIAPARLAWQCE